MIKRFFLLALTLAVAAVSARADKVDEILQKHLDAIGSNNYKNIKTLKIVGAVEMMGMQITFTNYFKRPDKFRSENSVMGQNSIQVYDGQKGWASAGGDVQEMDENAVKQIKSSNQMIESPFEDYKEKGLVIKLIGREKVGDVESFKLHITNKDGQQMHTFIGASDYLVKKIEVIQAEGAGNMEIMMKDYKKINDALFPQTLELKSQMGAQTIKFTSIEANIDMPDTLFAKP